MRYLVVLLALGCVAPARPPSIQQREVQLIGKTQPEVKQVLGPPAYTEFSGTWVYPQGMWDPVTEGPVAMYIVWDEDNRVKTVSK